MTDDHALDLSSVALFPLPSVVLFPRAVLPLHIFEDRYRAMTRDALVGDRVIAMALLRPGWEKSYYGRPAIDPVVCAGRILSHERLPDGKYNFLLQGVARCRIVEELTRDEPYRIARLETIVETPALEIDLDECRRQLTEVFDESLCACAESGWGWTVPVTAHPAGAGPFGAEQLAGNVWEWVADPTPDGWGLVRGGSYLDTGWGLRASRAQPADPARATPTTGFRIAIVPDGRSA